MVLPAGLNTEQTAHQGPAVSLPFPHGFVGTFLVTVPLFSLRTPLAPGYRKGWICPMMLLVITREQEPEGFVYGAGVVGAPPGCGFVGWEKLQEPSLASPGRAAWRERWQQPGDVTAVLAGSPLLLMASVAAENLCFSETFLSVELSLWQGEERRSNFNNLIKYIM